MWKNISGKSASVVLCRGLTALQGSAPSLETHRSGCVLCILQELTEKVLYLPLSQLYCHAAAAGLEDIFRRYFWSTGK